MSERQDLESDVNFMADTAWDIRQVGDPMPTWLVVAPGGRSIACTPFSDAAEKTAMVDAVSGMLVEQKATRSVFVADTWVADYEGQRLPAADSGFDPEQDLPRPSESLDRKEAITATGWTKDIVYVVSIVYERVGGDFRVLDRRELRHDGLVDDGGRIGGWIGKSVCRALAAGDN